jgi:iron complex transport system substrate-binding protein
MAEQPRRIISLSPTATETLFAIGAGDQVVAVDEYSTYPEDAPFTDLSGYTPNIEALASYDPDLIVVAFDPEGMITAAFGDDVPVASQFPATGREDLLAQIEQLGALTGHLDEAEALVSDLAARWDQANQVDANGASVYIEVDTTFYAASSNSFMGAALTGLGYTNIADAADTTGGGFPQLSAEAIIQASPDVIIVGTDYGTTAGDIAARPGWDSISALINDQVMVIPSDISSRWGPRFIEYIETMAELADAPVTVSR